MHPFGSFQIIGFESWESQAKAIWLSPLLPETWTVLFMEEGHMTVFSPSPHLRLSRSPQGPVSQVPLLWAPQQPECHMSRSCLWCKALPFAKTNCSTFPGMSFRSLCQGAGWSGSSVICGPKTLGRRLEELSCVCEGDTGAWGCHKWKGKRSFHVVPGTPWMETRGGQALQRRGQDLPTLTGSQGVSGCSPVPYVEGIVGTVGAWRVATPQLMPALLNFQEKLEIQVFPWHLPIWGFG